jgi:hypothetical protein
VWIGRGETLIASHGKRTKAGYTREAVSIARRLSGDDLES